MHRTRLQTFFRLVQNDSESDFGMARIELFCETFARIAFKSSLRIKARKYSICCFMPLNTSTTFSAASPRESSVPTSWLIQVPNFGAYWWSTWVNMLLPISLLSTVVDGWPGGRMWSAGKNQTNYTSFLSSAYLLDSLFLSRSITFPSFYPYSYHYFALWSHISLSLLP